MKEQTNREFSHHPGSKRMRKTNQLFDAERLRLPTGWRRPSVLAASLGINLLALMLPMVILQLYDRIIPHQAIETFAFLMAGMVAVVVIDTALKIFRSQILSWDGARFDHRESLKAMNRILDAESLPFEEKPAGFYLDRMHALERMQEFFSGQSLLLIMDFPFVVIFLALVWVIAGPLVWVPLTLLLLFLFASLVTGRHLHEALESRSLMEDRRQNFLIEILRGIHTIKSMAMEAPMCRRYERLQHQSATGIYELSRINSIVQGIGASFSQLATVAFVGLGSLEVIEGQLSIGALAAGTMLTTRALQPGLKAMGLWTQFQSIRLARRKLQELFALPTERSGTLRPERGIRGAVELRDIHFRYPGQERPLLQGLSLSIRPGEAIAITGDNGAGKSTLINILAGFIQPQQGEVKLDGHDIRDYDLEYLRSQIGIVPQSGTLFEGTILENMTLYREGEAIDQAIELSRMLGLDKILSRLPEGLDTRIGGAAADNLAEGVRQKIIIVRSLVGKPPLILFDDANASFDIKNDIQLQRVMEQLKGRHTLVIVSHRPSFMRLCDRQLILRDGKLHDATQANGEKSESFAPPLSATRRVGAAG
ncbi:MAG: ATP-binding cassette domain-containing protein [Gammaproteobacteria bacterium]|nr:MAG: ATP-binding cassette domain-containing protein [Gammaproteobacteria bacterium]